MPNTYTKLKSGEWGARVEGQARIGAQVQVTTKAGEVKSETVEKVLWTGPDKETGKTISLCAIKPQAPSAARSKGSRRGRNGPGAGAAAPVRGYSQYCTDRPDCGCYDCAS